MNLKLSRTCQTKTIVGGVGIHASHDKNNFILSLKICKILSSLNKRERDHYYPLLVARDGEYCNHCQKTLSDLQDTYHNSASLLEIHEIYYSRPLKLKNMRLFCHGCNHLEIFNKKNIDSMRSETPEYATRRKQRPKFIQWLTGELELGHGKISYDEAIGGGALYADVSTQTIKNWIYPLIHAREGTLTIFGEYLCIRGNEPNMADPVVRQNEFENKIAKNHT